MRLHILLVLLLVAGQAFASFRVDEIKIEGLKRISNDAVLQALDVQKGQQFTDSQATAAVKSLFKTGFFKDVQLEREGNILVVKLKERAVIAKLEITGTKSHDHINKILKEAEIVEGLAYDPNVILKAEKEIEKYYLTRGRYSVKVESKVVEKPRNRVEVTFNVYEGDEAKIKKIRIVGNKVFSEKVLLKQLLHGTGGFFSWYTKNDRYLKEKLDADLEILQSYYMNRGYINMQVDSTQVSITKDKKHVYITINVTEGEQYRFADINVKGQFILPKQEIEEIITGKISKGAVFSREAVVNTKNAVTNKLGNFGYSRADVRLNYEQNDKDRTIDVEFVVVPNQRVMVRRILFSGNYLTQDFVLRRMMPQFEGTWISNQHVEEGKEEILRSGYASSVDIETVSVADKSDQVDLEYKLEEQKTMQLHAGIGYSAADRLSFNIGANVKNFVGTGRDVDFLFENSKVATSYSFGYHNPYFTVDGIGMGYKVYYTHSNVSKASNVSDYSTDTLGGNVNWSFPMSQYSRLFVVFGYDRTNLKLNYNSAPLESRSFIDAKGSKYKEYTVSAIWKRNTLNRFIFPTKGMLQRITVKHSLPISKLRYYTVGYDADFYTPITEKYTFNVFGEVDYGGRYAKDPYPFFRHHHTGGADSVRGFEERSLGPLDSHKQPFGGNLLLNLRTSVIFPLPFKPDAESFRTSIFLDAGQVYDTHNRHRLINGRRESRNPTGVRYSTGISLKVDTPLGAPITVSLAKPLNAKKGDNTETFSFSLYMNT